jgi:hypothetical protein
MGAGVSKDVGGDNVVGMCVSVRTKISAWCSAARRMREAHLWGVSPSTLTQRIVQENGDVGAGISELWSLGDWSPGDRPGTRSKVSSL